MSSGRIGRFGPRVEAEGARVDARPLRVGIVCPYSWDVPGGVQSHIRDLTQHLQTSGYDVSVLAPSMSGAELPDYVTSAGRPMKVNYNGSTARVAVGPTAAHRTRQWLRFTQPDVVHVHEGIHPSLSVPATLFSEAPVVATFHSAGEHFRAMELAGWVMQPVLNRLAARIAVSADAERTMNNHLGGDAVIIPNGVDVNAFAHAPTRPEWEGTDASGGKNPHTIAFLGRLDEPRKGLATLLAAFPRIAAENPGVRLLVAGKGDALAARAQLPGALQSQVSFLGMIDDAEKASLLRSVDAYVAPNTGGESFGIILTEAMAAGAPVVASDLGAFRRVLDDGRAGALFTVEDPAALAASTSALLQNPAARAALKARASEWVRQYDWTQVGSQLEGIYQSVIDHG